MATQYPSPLTRVDSFWVNPLPTARFATVMLLGHSTVGAWAKSSESFTIIAFER